MYNCQHNATMRLDELNPIHSGITTIPCEQIVARERWFQRREIAGAQKSTYSNVSEVLFQTFKCKNFH